MKFIKSIFSLLLCITTTLSFSQGEFIIEIDPTTGSFIQPNTPIDSVTWVQASVGTYDEIHGLYIFVSGSPTKKLLSVNSNDSIFFSPSLGSIYECQYDNSSGIMYGLQNPSSGQFIFGSVNQSTANYSQIGAGPIPGMNGVSQGASTFDKNNHRYIIRAPGNILFSIDALTGNILSSPTAILNSGEGIVNICYDDSTNNLYGILQNSTQTFLVLINTSTGTVTKIGSGSTGAFGGGTSTIDKINRRYIYYYQISGTYYVAVMDIPTGNIIYNNVIPFGSGNINSIAYDNVRKKLYAEHWGAVVTNIKTSVSASTIKIYPIPTTNNIVIESPTMLGAIIIYNSLGQILFQTKSKSNQEQIDISNFPTGIYTIQVQDKYNKIIKD